MSREALKVFVSVEDAETQSEDIRVSSGANIVLPVRFGFLFLPFFFLMKASLDIKYAQRNLLVSFANVWVTTIPVRCTTGNNL